MCILHDRQCPVNMSSSFYILVNNFFLFCLFSILFFFLLIYLSPSHPFLIDHRNSTSIIGIIFESAVFSPFLFFLFRLFAGLVFFFHYLLFSVFGTSTRYIFAIPTVGSCILSFFVCFFFFEIEREREREIPRIGK